MQTLSVDHAVAWIRERSADGSRVIVGLSGCPGAGKSTLSARLLDALGADAVVVPMDGFHLDNPVLEAHGTRHRKGAPETFDAAGYAALLGRLRAQRADEVVFAPRYDRSASASIAGAIEIGPSIPVVITEGNYLLLDREPWRSARRHLDACWYVDIADEVRLPRLIARHVSFGKTPEAAEEWVTRSDEANAALVKASADSADARIPVD